MSIVMFLCLGIVHILETAFLKSRQEISKTSREILAILAILGTNNCSCSLYTYSIYRAETDNFPKYR